MNRYDLLSMGQHELEEDQTNEINSFDDNVPRTSGKIYVIPPMCSDETVAQNINQDNSEQ